MNVRLNDLLSQRRRRVNAARKSKFSTKRKFITSLNLTPGTPFMLEVEDRLKRSVMQRCIAQAQHLKIDKINPSIGGGWGMQICV